MQYRELYLKLKEAIDLGSDRVEVSNYTIYKVPFVSKASNVLPGFKKRYCSDHNQYFSSHISHNGSIEDIHHNVDVNDVYVTENKKFDYFLLLPKKSKKVNKIILLFHGFNEKSWDKYLPWGAALCDRLNCGVLFFPLAFHMSRAPLSWSDKRKMFELSNIRRQQYPNIMHSTLSNVAISIRMQSLPQRFIWSGIQTYYDVIQLIEDVKAGHHHFIDKDFSCDIFAYSIGGFLGEILKLTNYKGYFNQSKLCLFCSGPVFNRLSPVSKYILDSEANVALYSYLIEHFEVFLGKDEYLSHYMNGDHMEGKIFYAMLDFKRLRGYRESLLKKYEDQIYAISLKKDTVIPSFEVMNTLCGAYRDIHIKVDTFDFNYPYSHETPFPIKKGFDTDVTKEFNGVFDRVVDFLDK